MKLCTKDWTRLYCRKSYIFIDEPPPPWRIRNRIEYRTFVRDQWRVLRWLFGNRYRFILWRRRWKSDLENLIDIGSGEAKKRTRLILIETRHTLQRTHYYSEVNTKPNNKKSPNEVHRRLKNAAGKLDTTRVSSRISHLIMWQHRRR